MRPKGRSAPRRSQQNGEVTLRALHPSARSQKKKKALWKRCTLRAFFHGRAFLFWELRRSGFVRFASGFGNLFRRNARSCFALCPCASSHECSSVLGSNRKTGVSRKVFLRFLCPGCPTGAGALNYCRNGAQTCTP